MPLLCRLLLCEAAKLGGRSGSPGSLWDGLRRRGGSPGTLRRRGGADEGIEVMGFSWEPWWVGLVGVVRLVLVGRSVWWRSGRVGGLVGSWRQQAEINHQTGVKQTPGRCKMFSKESEWKDRRCPWGRLQIFWHIFELAECKWWRCRLSFRVSKSSSPMVFPWSLLVVLHSQLSPVRDPPRRMEEPMMDVPMMDAPVMETPPDLSFLFQGHLPPTKAVGSMLSFLGRAFPLGRLIFICCMILYNFAGTCEKVVTKINRLAVAWATHGTPTIQPKPELECWSLVVTPTPAALPGQEGMGTTPKSTTPKSGTLAPSTAPTTARNSSGRYARCGRSESFRVVKSLRHWPADGSFFPVLVALLPWVKTAVS